MATALKYLSGSDRIGSPLIIRVRSAIISGTVAFHNLKCDVSVALQTADGDPVSSDLAPTTITMSRPVGMGEEVDIDISSALRSVADRYEYSPTQLTMPYVTAMSATVPVASPTGSTVPDASPSATVPDASPSGSTPAIRVYDEYMQDGILHTDYQPMTIANLPTNDAGEDCMYLGSYTDLERLLAPRDQNGEAWLGMHSEGARPITAFTRKPSTVDDPELVPLGCTRVIPRSVNTCWEVKPTSAGMKQIADWGKPFYVFTPRPLERILTIRFINGFGLMETVHVRTGRKQQQRLQSQQHLRALMESFGTPGRSYYTKSHLRQEWQLSTGPITETWLHWYAHDFLLTPAAWISLSDLRTAVYGTSTAAVPDASPSAPDLWIPIHIKPEDTLDLLNTNETETLPEFTFTIQFDLDGPIII